VQEHEKVSRFLFEAVVTTHEGGWGGDLPVGWKLSQGADQPSTLHPTPYTLHPTPHTLNPHLPVGWKLGQGADPAANAGCWREAREWWMLINPQPYTTYTLHPTPYILHPTPSTLNPHLPVCWKLGQGADPAANAGCWREARGQVKWEGTK